MSSLDDLLQQLPIDQLAAALGVDPEMVAKASGAAVPALVEGMQANAADEAGAASLAKAVATHAKKVAAGAAPTGDLSSIDTSDGGKIVANVFGGNTDAVVNQLGGLGVSPDLLKKLLPMLAPLVMAFLGKMALGGKQDSGAANLDAVPAAADESDDGGGLGDLLGGLLGGGGSGGGGGLGDLLGGLLGGGGSGGGGGGLGDLLGGLLGGGRR